MNEYTLELVRNGDIELTVYSEDYDEKWELRPARYPKAPHYVPGELLRHWAADKLGRHHICDASSARSDGEPWTCPDCGIPWLVAHWRAA